ncbi:hypothetical protein PRUB_a0207 [Pseudoalteromonas rubra]|uniref:Uncharacterized protein n=1 Tax=Pseudoalteromonas rubra TaxID=43658 RepID=A0A8T0C501_9GAMM|nr:hypothetical protein PRUB_a0207 [Pseudoalteromonas rubra]
MPGLPASFFLAQKMATRLAQCEILLQTVCGQQANQQRNT